MLCHLGEALEQRNKQKSNPSSNQRRLFRIGYNSECLYFTDEIWYNESIDNFLGTATAILFWTLMIVKASFSLELLSAIRT